VESLDHQLRGGDVEGRAEGGDHVQEPELAAADPNVQGDEYPVGQIGRSGARPGYSRITAHFAGQFGHRWIGARQDLMIDAPQQVGAPLREVDDPGCQPSRMQGQAQGVNRRDQQLRIDPVQQQGGAGVARDDLPVAVDDKGRIGAVAREQPLDSRPDVAHVRVVVVQCPLGVHRRVLGRKQQLVTLAERDVELVCQVKDHLPARA
jgi:hypothetical protein